MSDFGASGIYGMGNGSMSICGTDFTSSSDSIVSILSGSLSFTNYNSNTFFPLLFGDYGFKPCILSCLA